MNIDLHRAVNYMLHEIRYICQNMKKRAPGSEGEREAAQYMARKLKTDCGCADVKVETFQEHPSAFYGYFHISAFFDVLSWAAFYLHPLASLLCGCVSMFLFIFQFLMYKQVIDPLFPLRTSTNVTAIRPCTGEVKQRILLNGHIDAAWEFPLNHLFGGVVFEIPGAMALVGVLTCMTCSVLSLSGCQWVHGMFGYLAVFVPFFTLVAITYNPRRIVDGANDNLSGCYMGLALLHELETCKIDLEHTEVGVVLTGSEEAGLRGAKAWCEKHRDDFKDVPTYIICYDTIHDPKYLAVNERDLNGTVRADAELGNLFLDAAKQLDIPCKRGWVPPFGGSTDSAAFTQGGFRSVGITGLNHKLEDYYHTRKDSWDNMDRKGLENCLAISVHLIDRMERSEEPNGTGICMKS